jgi:hypothetical protein
LYPRFNARLYRVYTASPGGSAIRAAIFVISASDVLPVGAS